MNATIDVLDYLQYPITVERRDGSYENEAHSCIASRKCRFVELRNSFNGFWSGVFHRCYSVSVQPMLAKTIKALGFSFDPILLDMLDQITWKLSSENGNVFAVMNYPRQLLRNDGNFQFVLQTESNGTILELFMVKSIEVLRRRNKGKSCVDEWERYDDMVLSKHLETVGCDNPYQKGNNITCENPQQKLEARYKFEEVGDKYYPAPCQELTNIDYGHQKIISPSNDVGLNFVIHYPNKIKIISQARSVDFHALIGNIGGYIGLFLGMC